MTDVTTKNYEEILPIIIGRIKEADFVSLDLEFSGLNALGVESVSLFDKPEERYEKLRRVVTTQKCTQLGISTFQRDADGAKHLYHVDAWNVLCMEPSFASFNVDQPTLGFDTECVNFYSQQCFDFTTLMIDGFGVPFLNKEKIRDLKEYLDKYPNFMEIFDDEPYDPVFFPEKVSYLQEKDKMQLIDKLRGVSKIIEAISVYKTPIVGHNMILDLMFLYHQFHAYLPESYEKFKEEIAKLLNIVYDTKYMTVCVRRMLDHKTLTHVHCDREIVKCSGLFVMYQHTTSALRTTPHFPNIQLCENINRYRESLKLGEQVELDSLDSGETHCHEGAFDAIVTGSVFLYLAHMSARINKEFSLKPLPPTMSEVFTNTRGWQHQIYLARATVPHVYLLGHDPQPNRPNWFKVSSIKGGGAPVAIHLLKEKLETIGPVDVRHISNDEIWIAGTSRKLAPKMKQLIVEEGYHLETIKIVREPHHYNVIKHDVKKGPRYTPLPSTDPRFLPQFSELNVHSSNL